MKCEVLFIPLFDPHFAPNQVLKEDLIWKKKERGCISLLFSKWVVKVIMFCLLTSGFSSSLAHNHGGV